MFGTKEPLSFFSDLFDRKLEERMHHMIMLMDLFSHDLVVNREVSKFYYMQKLAELRVLDDQLHEALERVKLITAERCKKREEVALNWKRDIRWVTERCRVDVDCKPSAV